ncbi:Pentatricopeptide repeat-containing protein [Camellia lanceoleosa]|nr:Pentatricopeptide repeat-containing protein [Camellia lanceoleosa]
MFKTTTNLNRSSNPKLQTVIELLKTCSSFKHIESAYAFMFKTNANEDCFFMNQFVTACSTFRRIDYALLAITQMKKTQCVCVECNDKRLCSLFFSDSSSTALFGDVESPHLPH